VINSNTQILVLGMVQDGGYPHTGCSKACCKKAWNDTNLRKNIASLAIIDHKTKRFWIIDITPDFKLQYQMINEYLKEEYHFAGIFLTHSHVGHYSGLLELGLEILNTSNIPVYVMPELLKFLKNNASINFLFQSQNIKSIEIKEEERINLSNNLIISSFLVPHRNEMSETVGYNIKTKNNSIIYIPDIDAWSDWNTDIIGVIKSNDLLFIDGTFYDKNELEGRNVEDVPHPSILESIRLFNNLDSKEKNKIYFTHLNHTNKLLHMESDEYKQFLNNDFNILNDKQIFNI
jgi:pyrroloquinoline quinone biosynthesis protein B